MDINQGWILTVQPNGLAHVVKISEDGNGLDVKTITEECGMLKKVHQKKPILGLECLTTSDVYVL